mmetsp:Transcript_19/g.28  ORF Transcript_19/g.28 Transcript_19/m.28 type:complete len:111 (+) Transcript_19:163-495(+)
MHNNRPMKSNNQSSNLHPTATSGSPAIMTNSDSNKLHLHLPSTTTHTLLTQDLKCTGSHVASSKRPYMQKHMQQWVYIQGQTPKQAFQLLSDSRTPAMHTNEPYKRWSQL